MYIYIYIYIYIYGCVYKLFGPAILNILVVRPNTFSMGERDFLGEYPLALIKSQEGRFIRMPIYTKVSAQDSRPTETL